MVNGQRDMGERNMGNEQCEKGGRRESGRTETVCARNKE